MACVYKKKPGSHGYVSSYSAYKLDKAIIMVSNGRTSILKASKKYQIPNGTLYNKETRIKGSIPKSQFPGLLKKLKSRLKSKNLVADFKATEIWQKYGQQTADKS